jgi:NADH-quinone oxidoreductase subunit M
MSALLSIVVLLPLAGALGLLVAPRASDRAVKAAWIAITAVDLALVLVLWIAYPGRPGVDGDFAYVTNWRWIPNLDAGYHLGLDGLSLPLLALTALLFLACAVYSLHGARRVRSFAALFLFLETTALGLFSALDLLLFFLFFDLSIVGMYFVIAGWGHEGARAAARKFFLYTFLGSIALLLAFIGVFLAAEPHTFDLVKLTRSAPLEGAGAGAALVLLALGVGLAVKTPTFPFHTWLPPAHTAAPAPGSAILAGILLKMGTYGFVRIAMPILPGTWRDYALVFVIVGAVSALYGALVALAQTDFKRMVAYTSVNHMGYVILAIGAAGLGGGTDEEARALAVTGAVTQMVSHGLLTGALFLLAGVLYDRRETHEMSEFGGLAARAPVFAGLTAVAAFASLGLPGFSGFVAEIQIFAGALSTAPVAVAVTLLAIVVTAALFLLALQRIFLGGARPSLASFSEISLVEGLAIAPLLGLSVAIGLAPRFLLDVIEPSAGAVARLVGG